MSTVASNDVEPDVRGIAAGTDDRDDDINPYTRCEQKHYEEIREKERQVAALAFTAEQTKATASAAKKNFEAADAELREFIHRGPDPQTELPFGKDADAWRDLPLSELTTESAVVLALEKHDFKTIGQVSAAINRDGFVNIPGFGPAKSQQLCDAFIQFWEKHPEFCESTPPEDEEPGEEEE